MKPTKVMIVGLNCGKTAVRELFINELDAFIELAGLKVVGTKTSRSVKLREEIEGMPILDRLVGPMYGGDGIVRYETSEAHDLFSC